MRHVGLVAGSRGNRRVLIALAVCSVGFVCTGFSQTLDPSDGLNSPGEVRLTLVGGIGIAAAAAMPAST